MPMNRANCSANTPNASVLTLGLRNRERRRSRGVSRRRLSRDASGRVFSDFLSALLSAHLSGVMRAPCGIVDRQRSDRVG